jgi:hypothetical protein
MPSPYTAAPPVAVRPAPWPPAPASRVPQTPAWSSRPASRDGTALATPPRPVVRLQAPEELIPTQPPAQLVLPSPAQLGVASGPAALPNLPVDWNVTRDRLDHLGAIGFGLAKLPEGAYRIAFDLPTSQPGRTHHIEAEAATEGAAVCRALDMADQWAGQRVAAR